MRVLVTGSAGFIGFHVAAALIARGDAVLGFDNLNPYYDVGLKRARLAELDRIAAAAGAPYGFVHADLADRAAVEAAFGQGVDGGPFDRVVHLAAQAGVRHSLEAPMAYVESNLTGFAHLLEACRQAATPHLVFASTSSVYGSNAAMPFEEGEGADHPLQLYAATKRANELMAHAYAHLFALPCTALRFFTVYGPWGRPDMAPMIFAEAILRGRPIRLFNEGRHSRDFTFVGDIVEGVIRAADRPALPDPGFDPMNPDPATSSALSALSVEPILSAKEPDTAYVHAHVFRLQELTAMRRITDLKSKLQRTNPVEHSAEYNRMFGELVALEQHRRTLRDKAIGG